MQNACRLPFDRVAGTEPAYALYTRKSGCDASAAMRNFWKLVQNAKPPNGFLPLVMHVPHMSTEQFRTLGHQLIDWIADYHEHIAERRVSPECSPGDVLAKLDTSAPLQPAGGAMWQNMESELDALVLPHVLHWQHPGFFGYFPCNASLPGILGEIAAAGINVNAMLWSTSPAATELEMRCMDWMAELIGLPRAFMFGAEGPGGGCIQGTASESTLVSLLAARAKARSSGVRDESMVLYASEHAHSSIIKAAMIAGCAEGPDDRRLVRLIPGDAEYRMDVWALARAIEADRSAGLTPIWLCATIGTTSSEAVDPVGAIAKVIPDACWLHVDAAFTGAAWVCEEHRWMLEGIERADSVCFNPHKWLLTNFDCDCFWVQDRAWLQQALSVTPEYLRNRASDAGAVVDFRDWQVPLGKRFRALKLLYVMRHYGRSGFEAHVRAHVEAAQWLESQVRASEQYELAAPRTTSLVCMRHRAGDEATRRVHEAVNASGRAFVSHTTLPDESGAMRYVLRVAIGGTYTTIEDVRALWQLLEEIA